MNNISTWDVTFYQYNKKSYTAVISFDSGLYLFNHQGQLSKRISLNKTRALEWVNNKLYCLSSNGVFHINGLDTVRATLPCETSEQITSFFHWNGHYYACAYPSNRWLQFKENEPPELANWKNQAPWDINYSILSQKITDSFLYLGSEGGYYIIDRRNQSTRFHLGRDKERNWAVWSIESCEDQIYLALGNVLNLERGAIVKHNPLTPTIALSGASKDPFMWGLTYDSINHILWASSLGKGCFALIFPNEYQRIPFGNIYTSHDWVCMYDEGRLYAKEETAHSWVVNEFPEIILDVQITANQLFVLTKDWLYIWSKNQNSFLRYYNVANYHFNKLVSAGYSLILHRPYGEWTSINIQTKKIETWPNSSKETAQFISADEIILSQEFNGSLHLVDIENHKTIPAGNLGINTNSPIAISKNLLITQIGQIIKVYQYSSKMPWMPSELFELKFLFDIPVRDIIRPGQEFKLFGTSRGVWILSNSHLYQLIISINGSIHIAGQQYIGQLSYQSIQNAAISNTHLWFYQSGVWKSIPLPKYSSKSSSNNFIIGYQNDKTEAVANSHLVIQPLDDFNIQFAHPDYWIHYHSLFAVSLKNDQDKFVFRQIKSGQEKNWIPGISSGNYSLFMSHKLGTQLAFVKTNFKNSGLALATAMILIIISTLVYFRDLSKNAESQLNLLRWKTLKSNMNPHFLHNSMSLIQSLIAMNENKKAIEVTGKIAEINRLFLETNLQEVSTLEKELEFCRKYIQIESLRFSNKKFSFTEAIEPTVNLRDWFIPPLLFQPVIENAIKHGLLLDPKTGELTLSISEDSENKTLRIQISNTGPGPAFTRSHGTQLGSELVQERIEHFNRLFQGKLTAKASSGFATDQNNLYVFSLYLEKS
ncbi:MAG: hypothetical protein RL577_733 [Bacteroidota bacterium]